jgi:hypothetical protein
VFTDLILANERGENIGLLINFTFDTVGFGDYGVSQIGGQSGGRWILDWTSDDDDGVSTSEALQRARHARTQER